MEIAYSETRTSFPLSSIKPLKKTLSKTITSLFILLILFPVIAIPFNLYRGNSGRITSPILVFLALFIFSTILRYIYEVFYYKKYYYDCTEEFVVIRKGVISTREITIPYERIQDVYVDQDVLDRMFGLYDVHLSSATISSGFEAHIDGVKKPGAEGLREFILKQIKQKSLQNSPSNIAPPPPPPVPPTPPPPPSILPPLPPLSTPTTPPIV